MNQNINQQKIKIIPIDKDMMELVKEIIHQNTLIINSICDPKIMIELTDENTKKDLKE